MALPRLFCHAQKLSQDPDTLVNALKLVWTREADSSQPDSQKMEVYLSDLLVRFLHSVNQNAGAGKADASCVREQKASDKRKDSWSAQMGFIFFPGMICIEISVAYYFFLKQRE